MDRYQPYLNRRRHERRHVGDNYFLFFDCGKTGIVKSISKGGIGFRYAAQRGYDCNVSRVQLWSTRSSESPVMVFSCKLVHEHLEDSFGPFEVRSCGVHFTNLSREQVHILDQILNAYTMKVA